MHQENVGKHFSRSVGEFRGVTNWVNCVHPEKLEDCHIDCKLNSSAKILAQDRLCDMLESPLLLVVQLCSLYYLKALLSWRISDGTALLSPTESELRFGA